MYYTCHYTSPLGGITLACDGTALAGLWFDGQKYFAATLPSSQTACTAGMERELPVFAEAKRWLDIYFEGRTPGFTPPLRMDCSAFRRAVWQLLLQIPYGQTTTYAALAEKLAAQRGVAKISAQAVGGAVGHNAISLIIPCHRVVGTNGSLTGYAGGLDKKALLLALERGSRPFC